MYWNGDLAEMRLVRGICIWLVTIGILGLIPALYAVLSLLEIYTNDFPSPETWRWKVSSANLLWTFIVLVAVYCVSWGGWIISAAAIYFGRWWGWGWAMSLCWGVFVISIDLCISYSLPILSLLASWWFVGMCTYSLTRPAVIEHCGVSGMNRRQIYCLIALGVAVLFALYYLGKLACARLI